MSRRAALRPPEYFARPANASRLTLTWNRHLVDITALSFLEKALRRNIEPQNPFPREPRFAFAYEHMAPGDRVLDYGCHDGVFGHRVRKSKQVEYVGVDKNLDALARAPKDVHVEKLTLPLPFPDGHFDVVTILEVLEHIHDQDSVLRELNRVLKPGGTIIVTTPRKHIFSFLDTANFKFMLPGVHRLYYRINHSKEEYRLRYMENPNNLVGDIETEKRWHQHFEDGEMRDIVERNGFSVQELDGIGLFNGLFTFINFILCLGFLFPRSRFRLIPDGAYQWDAWHFHSAFLICSARKQA